MVSATPEYMERRGSEDDELWAWRGRVELLVVVGAVVPELVVVEELLLPATAVLAMVVVVEADEWWWWWWGWEEDGTADGLPTTATLVLEWEELVRACAGVDEDLAVLVGAAAEQVATKVPGVAGTGAMGGTMCGFS